MTQDGLLVVRCLFDTIWRLFTSWHIPGTTTTPAAFFMFVGVCGLALKFLYRVSGASPDVGLGISVGHPSNASDLPSNAPALGTRAWVSGDGNMRSHR